MTPLDLPRLPELPVPPRLEARTRAAAARAVPVPWRTRLPDLALAACTCAELVHVLRAVHVLP